MFIICRLDPRPNQARSIDEAPEATPVLMECPEPPKTPKYPVYKDFVLFEEDELPTIVRCQEFTWLVARSSFRSNVADHESPTDQFSHSEVPVWSAYNSLLHDPLKTTRSATPPLIPAPAHEWNTLLTVLMQVGKTVS